MTLFAVMAATAVTSGASDKSTSGSDANTLIEAYLRLRDLSRPLAAWDILVVGR
jgi:hypothetical protein